MPLDYNSVRDEYLKFKTQYPNDPTPLGEFAKQLDTVQGTPNERASAYHDTWYKQADAAIDRGFQATGLPKVGEAVGGLAGYGFDKLVGTNIQPIVEQIGRDTPRMITESLATIPEVGSGVGIPAAAVTWGNRLRKIAGYGSAAMRGYAQTESPIGAAISAGSMYGANKLLLPAERGGLDVGGKAARAVYDKLDTAGDLVAGQPLAATNGLQRVMGELTRTGTDVATATGLNEATRQAMLTVTPEAQRTPGDRNPLTPENVASAVAGSAFFAPQMVAGLVNPIRVSPKQTRQLMDNLTTRDAQIKAEVTGERQPTPASGPIEDVSVQPDQNLSSRHEALYGIIRSELDAASIFERDGNLPDAERARANALSAIDEAAQGRFSPVNSETLSKIRTAVDSEARLQPPSTPEGFDAFVEQVRGMIDTMNEGRVSYENELVSREAQVESLPRFSKERAQAQNELDAWKKSWQENVGKSWHPNARAKEVVDRVWQGGNLQPLTPEWLQSEFNASFDTSGNPQFAARVVAQKVANYALDKLPTAMAEEAKTRKAVTEPSKSVRQIGELDMRFAQALGQLPPEVRDAVIRRSVEIQRYSNFSPEQADVMGITEGVRVNKYREQVTAYPEWQRSVVRAVTSYDPDSKTILLRHPNQGYLRVPISRLVQKGENGKYAWEPSERRVTKGMGGKSVKETNIEALPTKGEQDAVGAFDEEEFKAAMAQSVGGESLVRTPGDAFTMAETPQDLGEKLGQSTEGVSKMETSLSEKLAGVKDKVTRNLDSLNDDQLWALVQNEFSTNAGTREAKKSQARLAIKSALQDFMSTNERGVSPEGARMLQEYEARGNKPIAKPTQLGKVQTLLRNYFQEQTKVSGESKLAPHVERIARIVKKLADDKAVERAKTEGPNWKFSQEQAQVTTEQKPKENSGTLVNPPKPGEFVNDVTRTVRAVIDQNLGRQGYSGTSREFLTHVATALALQMKDVPADFYRLVGKAQGLASAKPEIGRLNIGLAVDQTISPKEGAKWSLRILQTLSHEITHLDGYIRDGLIPKPDAYSDERGRVYSNMRHLAENLHEDEREIMLQIAREWLPEPLRSPIRQKDGRPYGTSNPEEFVAEMTGHITNILALESPQGRETAKEMLAYLPTEVRDFARNTFMTVADTMEAMKTAVEGYGRLTGNTDPFIMMKGFDAIIDSARVMSDFRKIDFALANAREVSNLLTKGTSRSPQQMTNAVWFQAAKELQPVVAQTKPQVSDSAGEAIRYAQQLFSPRQVDKTNAPSKFAQWIYPFTNLMVNMERQGVPLARDVLEMVNSLEPGISRMYSAMMRGFLKQERDGSFNLDKTHPLVSAVAEDPNGRWRDGVNRVSQWQQDNKTQTMFVVDNEGKISVNTNAKGAQESWDKIRGQLSPEDAQKVMGISVALDQSNQFAASFLTKEISDGQINTVATYLMAANKQMTYDQALGLAKMVYDGYLTGNQLQITQSGVPQPQLAALDRLLVGNRTKESPAGDGLLAKFLDVKKLLESRPGFRSESLPHDWILKYKTKDGQTLYDSRPHEAQARARAKVLESEGATIIGEVVNKNDLKQYTEFDNPDAILAKVAESERFTFDRFVAEMEVKHGSALADDLREGYAPVAQSMKELGVKGLNKFLAERRALVDRGNFDYVDGTMAYLGRLSASLAMRSTQNRIRLILNDPRARINPTFRKLVNEHITEMMQPQTEFGRQMRTFVGTWFLGANVGSAAINGTQSLTTLVPWLISGADARYTPKGGIVGGWKTMGQGMADAAKVTLSNDWQNVAVQANRLPPQNHTMEQALASMYRRHVEAGGINQTVLDDLAYGRDQRMLINAKFGRGDYGPVPVDKMVRDKLYVGSQMMLGLFKVVEHFNAKTAFLSGIRQGYELGLRGDELYQYGTKVQSLATFGGGRANAPGLTGARWAREGQLGARSAVGVVNALQQYGYGVLAMYGQLGKDALGKSPALTPLQRRAAQKAFGTMLMTQTALAGALGLPFVGATLTLLENLFGIPATQAVREGLASLGGGDDELGSSIAETALNGFPNQWVGLDLSSRLGVSNLLGTSSYRGFAVQDMIGPLGSVVGNATDALNLFGQAKPQEAFSKLVPAAFKNVVEMSDTKTKYGDYGFRDKAGNLLYQPTDNESLAYAFGFRPAALSRKRQMQTLLTRANERTTTARDNELDALAQGLARGDAQAVQRYAYDLKANDPTVDVREVMRAVLERAVASQTPKDLMASGSRWNESERMGIARTFGKDVNERQSDLQAVQLQAQYARLLGDPRLLPQAESYQSAAMVDALVRSRGIPRSQAVRLVQFLGL